MKNRIIKSILTLALMFMVVPTMGQDYMEVYFKDGNKYKFFMPYVNKIYVSKYDADGNMHNDYQYQHVITKTNTYVYELADIDYISYTDCDEEVVEQNIVSSLETVLPIIEKCETLSDVEKRIESIKNADSIEDAWSDGSQLCIKIKDWGVMSFHFHAEEQADEAKEQQWEKDFMRKISSAIIHKAATGTSPLKVAIANQTKNNDMPVWYYVRKRLDKINNFFKGCGITPVYVDPSIDFFSSGMYDYDVVVLCTHGAVMTKEDGTPWFDQNGDNVHFLFTSEPLGAISKTYLSTSEPSDDELLAPTNTLKNLLDRKGLMDYLSKDEIRIDWIEELRGTFDYWVAYPLVTENFIIEASEGKEFTNSNSLIFAAVCHSLEGTHSLARKLQNRKNLNGYIGFDGEVSASVASNAALYYFMSLLSGNSMGKSEALIPDDYKFDTSWYKNTSLASSFRNEDSFLFSTVTKQVDQTTAQNAFNSSGYVEVEGNTTLSDPDADNVVKMGFECSTNENFSPASSVVSSDVIKLTKPLDNGNGNVQFRAKLTDLQPGNTYFYRAYTYDGMNYNYGKPCSFEIEQSGGGIVAYTSCPDDNHPHLIDLGLPSGTKWACCNVGASKPEDYGGYFAWGRTEEYQTEKSLSDFTGSDIAGSQYDVAHVKWGDSWVMPSYYQLKELKDECHWEYVKDNVKGTDIGIRFTGPNGGSIILPLAGYCLDERHLNVGKQFGYYSSTQSYSYFTYYYHYLRFSTTDGLSLDYYEYSIGYSVRPVSMIKTSLVYPDLQLSQTQLSIVKGKSSTVEIIAGSGKYGVTSPNSSIAIASLSGTTITISGVAEGTAKIIVEDVQTNQQFFIDITVGSSSCPNNHHPHLIDLGLPSGTKWACCNIGAQKPEEYGGYFAWGETSEKEYYDWSSYTHCDGSSRTCHDIGKDIAGTQYDAATANWGSPWVMPSKVQMEELVKNCTSEWTTENGVNGRSFTGPNGVSIFLPAAGYRQRGDLLSTGACGVYWSSTLGKSDAYDAWDLYFLSGYVETPDDDRGYGLSVRPVRKN